MSEHALEPDGALLARRSQTTREQNVWTHSERLSFSSLVERLLQRLHASFTFSVQENYSMDQPPKKNSQDLTTTIVHNDRSFGVEHGGIRKPIHTSVQYGFERTADLIGAFQGTNKGAFNYARQGTPTTAALEAKLTRMEEGVGTVCFSSGMAALTAVFFTLLRAGDHVVSSKFVFGNTNSLFGTLRHFGVEITMVDAGTVNAVKDALRSNTKMVFVETIANPGTQVPDLEAIGHLCRERRLLYVVDNTVTSPALFRPRSVGASLVMNSLSKTIGGHGIALGGSVTDTGEFDWRNCSAIADSYRSADPVQWGLIQLRKKGLRDMGAALSSEQAHQIATGAETLELRVQRSSATALRLATFLEQHPAVARVYYPGLPSHPQHEQVKRWFSDGSWLLSFELRDATRTLQVVDGLRVPVKATGLGDTRTLVIPVASTIFWEAGPEVRAEMGISDGMVRVAVGIEDPEALISDFAQALSA